MRSILQKRSLRFVFAANVISMLGSGMNSAAVAWTILQRTHSEMALGTFAALQTIPAMLMLPFTGVVIDREDRRRLVMWLDASRAVVILVVMVLAFLHRCQGHAGKDAAAIDVNSASSALAAIATDLGARQPEVIA